MKNLTKVNFYEGGTKIREGYVEFVPSVGDMIEFADGTEVYVVGRTIVFWNKMTTNFSYVNIRVIKSNEQ